MENRSSITSLMSAFGRAFHAQTEEHPVFRDDLVRELITEEEYAAVRQYILEGANFFEPEYSAGDCTDTEIIRKIVNTHIAPSPLCRAAYTENALKTAVITGTEQYVILGAGLDTFAFREREFLSKHKVYEADHPATGSDKTERIARAGWDIPKNLTFVPVDLTKDSLSEKLKDSGFDPSRKTFFSWLGVTYYLSADEIEKTLDEISAISADGSTLVFDCPDEGFFSAAERRVKNTIMMAAAGGEPMKSSFSYAELERMLERHGFLIYEFMTPQDIQKNIIDAASASIKAFEHVNYCLCVKKR